VWPCGRVAMWPCGRVAVVVWPWSGGRGRGRGRVAAWPGGRVAVVVAGWPGGRVAGWPGGRVAVAVAVAGPWPGWPATKKNYCVCIYIHAKWAVHVDDPYDPWVRVMHP